MGKTRNRALKAPKRLETRSTSLLKINKVTIFIT
jgi:hypothetical protein